MINQTAIMEREMSGSYLEIWPELLEPHPSSISFVAILPFPYSTATWTGVLAASN